MFLRPQKIEIQSRDANGIDKYHENRISLSVRIPRTTARDRVVSAHVEVIRAIIAGVIRIYILTGESSKYRGGYAREDQVSDEQNKPKVARSAALMFVSGLLILLPGFATDILGVIFLIPPIGNRIVKAFSSLIGARMVRMPGYGNAGFTGSQFASYVDGEVIRGVVIRDGDLDQKENGGPAGPPQILN